MLAGAAVFGEKGDMGVRNLAKGGHAVMQQISLENAIRAAQRAIGSSPEQRWREQVFESQLESEGDLSAASHSSYVLVVAARKMICS